ALIEFNRAGKVVNVTLLEPTGLRSWDQALEDSLYRWTAVISKSAKLRNLPADKTLKFTIRLLLNQFRAEITVRSEKTPLIVGAPGSRIDLVLHGLYFDRPLSPTVTMTEVDYVHESGLGTA
ncbi:MAG: hypothetical protein ACK55I_40575, partial [bacterium]